MNIQPLNPKEVLMIQLASSRLGRITLHAFCLLRHPARLRWHWNGIRREFAH